MKEKPILFSAPMVRAILEGRKTQTRRIVKLPKWFLEEYPQYGSYEIMSEINCPYGSVSNFLWVRETFVYRHKYDRFYYRADYPTFEPYAHDGWKPSIFMPRTASRISLEVTDFRVERLQDILEEDAKEEGVGGKDTVVVSPITTPTYRKAFSIFWNFINDKRGIGWEKNPWVWVVEFKSAIKKGANNEDRRVSGKR